MVKQVDSHRHGYRFYKSLVIATALVAAVSSGSSNSARAADDKRETITIVDELKREITLPVPIKAVYPDHRYQTELVRAIGAGESIVAIDQGSDPKKNPANEEYLAGLAGLPQAGHFDSPNWETIVSSGAEVFFARRNSPWQDAVDKLTPFGIPVIVVTAWDPKVLREQLPNVGKIFGKEEGAAALADLYDDIDTLLAERLKGVEPKTVYFENANDFITSVPGSGWHDTIILGGGKNIFEDINIGNTSSASVHTYTVDPVEIINRNPDVIIRNGVDGLALGYKPWDRQKFVDQAERIANRPGWSSVKAVENNEIYVFNNFLYSALGKQFGSLVIAKWLHPDRFADVDLDAYLARWLEPQGVRTIPAAEYLHKLGQ